MPYKISLDETEKEALEKIRNLLKDKGIKVKTIQVAWHDENPVIYTYISSSKYPLSRRGLKRLTVLERQIKAKLPIEAKVIVIPS
jgi:transposase